MCYRSPLWLFAIFSITCQIFGCKKPKKSRIYVYFLIFVGNFLPKSQICEYYHVIWGLGYTKNENRRKMGGLGERKKAFLMVLSNLWNFWIFPILSEFQGLECGLNSLFFFHFSSFCVGQWVYISKISKFWVLELIRIYKISTLSPLCTVGWNSDFVDILT